MTTTTMNSYETGTLVQLTGTFTNVSGVLTDPTTIVCTVRDPAGNVTTPAVTRVSAGIYTANLDLTNATPGVWAYRFAGTGVCQAAEEAALFVETTTV